jgi:hypothetical protein
MTGFTFRPAVRDNVPLLIGLAGGTGSGKTYSAMRLAKGLAGPKPFAVIDTEAGRAKHYAASFAFDHGDLAPLFRPAAYMDAIEAADRAGYPVIVVDSMSHVWSGDGGCLDWHEEELDRRAGDDWKKRDALTMSAWIKPKMEHKKMVARLLQVRAHVILCFRAEEKVEIVKIDGKTQIVPKVGRTGLDGWMPICEKSLPFELTMSFLLTAEQPGHPKAIKLEHQHRAMFSPTTPITEVAGEQLAAWARGDGPTRTAPAEAESSTAVGDPTASWNDADLTAALKSAALKMGDLAGVLGVPVVTRDNYPDAIDRYLGDNPGSTLESLVAAAVEARFEPAPDAAIDAEQQPEMALR